MIYLHYSGGIDSGGRSLSVGVIKKPLHAQLGGTFPAKHVNGGSAIDRLSMVQLIKDP